MPKFTVYRKSTGEIVKAGRTSDAKDLPQETHEHGVLVGVHANHFEHQVDLVTRELVPRTLPLPPQPPRPVLKPLVEDAAILFSRTPTEITAKLDAIVAVLREIAMRLP